MNTKSQTAPVLLYRLAQLSLPVVFIVIALGAFTRLVDAGLGCPDWPTCYGHLLWPTSEQQIDKANLRFSETPVETDKTWPEQLHRLAASALGLISLAIFFLAVRLSPDKKQNRHLTVLVGVFLLALIAKIAFKASADIGAEAFHDITDILIGLVMLAGFAVLALQARQKGPSPQPLKLAALIVGFVILQGLFGMWTVTLKVWPQVVTIHLLGGFTMAALLWLLVLRLQGRPWQLPVDAVARLQGIRPLAIAALVVVVMQIALGGWTTANYAAVACPDLPTCQGELWPEMDFASGFNITQGIGPNYLGGKMDNAARMAIHKTHRLGAIVTMVVVLWLVIALIRKVKTPQTTATGYIILAVLLVQLALGLGNIVFHFPLSVAVAHNAGGAILLLTVLTLLYRMQTAAKTGNKEL